MANNNTTELIAQMPILYHSRQFQAGDVLPVNDEVMVEAWLESGAAAYVEVPTEKPAKAKPMTAEPGQFGQAVNSETENGEDLIGKVPKTKARKK